MRALKKRIFVLEAGWVGERGESEKAEKLRGVLEGRTFRVGVGEQVGCSRESDVDGEEGGWEEVAGSCGAGSGEEGGAGPGKRGLDVRRGLGRWSEEKKRIRWWVMGI